MVLAAARDDIDQSKTSDRGQGDFGPDPISGAISKGLQGLREVGKQVPHPLHSQWSLTLTLSDRHSRNR